MANRKPKRLAKPKSTVRAGPPLDTPPGQPHIKASLDDDLASPLDAIGKMRGGIEDRNATLGDTLKKLTEKQTEGFSEALSRIKPKVDPSVFADLKVTDKVPGLDYRTLRESLWGTISQADKSAELLDQFMPPITIERSNPELTELQSITAILRTNTENVSATGKYLDTLVQLTADNAIREGRSGDRLTNLTLALVLLTVVLAVPEIPHIWTDWIIPAWELIRGSGVLVFAITAVASLALAGLWRRLR